MSRLKVVGWVLLIGVGIFLAAIGSEEMRGRAIGGAIVGVMIVCAVVIRSMVVNKVQTGYAFPEASEALEKELAGVPLKTLQRVQRAREWEGLDVIQKDAQRANMDAEEKAELRACIDALREWDKKLSKGDGLKELVRSREKSEAEKWQPSP